MKTLLKNASLKAIVVIMSMCGSLTLAIIDPNQRNAFMTICITAIGGFFGAEVPSIVRRRNNNSNRDDDSNV
ncbi:hypothetical protein [Cyanophage BHS3]|nr:hypothetical protein [Cyanophage BHS3]